jgi:hypothetical protein
VTATVTNCVPEPEGWTGNRGPCPENTVPSSGSTVVAVIGTQDAPVTDFGTAFAAGFGIVWLPILIAWALGEMGRLIDDGVSQ